MSTFNPARLSTSSDQSFSFGPDHHRVDPPTTASYGYFEPADSDLDDLHTDPFHDDATILNSRRSRARSSSIYSSSNQQRTRLDDDDERIELDSSNPFRSIDYANGFEDDESEESDLEVHGPPLRTGSPRRSNLESGPTTTTRRKGNHSFEPLTAVELGWMAASAAVVATLTVGAVVVVFVG
ncbi:hypothetical protein JCM10212_005792 [Sporobolomyces blumeae]